jgi:glycosyltransferase involved in cell wall biosynthesis
MKDPQPETQPRAHPAGTRLRVCQVVFSLEPGGLENGVVNLSNGLDPDRFETEIVCLERVGAFADRLREGIRVTCLDKPPGLSPATMTRFAAHLRRRRPDLLHTHNLGPLVQAYAARTLAALRLPILHGEHGTLRPEDLSPRRLRLRRWLYRRCARVHTVSASLCQHLEQLGLPSDRIVSLLNGVDAERFRPPANRAAAKEIIGLPRDSFVVGMVGRLIPSKRHQLLLEAFARIGPTEPRMRLLLLGDGGEAREAVLSAIQEHPLRERIHWVGHQAEPAPFYQAMDLLAMPSSVEGLSNALLEAMACGVPCLAHPACGATEVVADGKNGLLRAMDRPEEIAAALAEVLARPDTLASMAREARVRVETDFSLEAMVARYARLFGELAGSR